MCSKKTKWKENGRTRERMTWKNRTIEKAVRGENDTLKHD